MASGTAPLPDPAVTIRRVIPEDLSGLGQGGGGKAAEAGSLQMLLDQAGFKGGLAGNSFHDGVVGRRIDP